MWICFVVVVTIGRAHSYTTIQPPDVEERTDNISDTSTSETPEATVQTVEIENITDDSSYLAAILHNNFLLGAGAIVGDKWILTTAFQLGAFKAEQLAVRVGSASAVAGGQLLTVDQLFLHPMFQQFNNDLALLRTTEAIELSNSSRPILVAEAVPNMGEGAMLWVWDSNSSVQKNQADILPMSECRVFYPDFELTESNICAVLDHVLPFQVSLFGSPLVYNATLVGLYMGMEANVYKPSLCSNLPTLVGWVDAMMKNETATQLLFPLT